MKKSIDLDYLGRNERSRASKAAMGLRSKYGSWNIKRKEQTSHFVINNKKASRRSGYSGLQHRSALLIRDLRGISTAPRALILCFVSHVDFSSESEGYGHFTISQLVSRQAIEIVFQTLDLISRVETYRLFCVDSKRSSSTNTNYLQIATEIWTHKYPGI